MILTTSISSLIFLVSVAVYATMIYYEDRKALLYNSNWIHREEDIDFLQGKRISFYRDFHISDRKA